MPWVGRSEARRLRGLRGRAERDAEALVILPRWRGPHRGSGARSAARRGPPGARRRGAPARGPGGLGEAREARGEPLEHRRLAGLDLFREAPGGGLIALAAGLGELLAEIHEVHEEGLAGAGLGGLGELDAGAPEERLGAGDGVAELAPGLVEVDGLAEGAAALGGAGAGEAIGMDHPGQLAEAPLGGLEVEVEARGEAEGGEGVQGHVSAP